MAISADKLVKLSQMKTEAQRVKAELDKKASAATTLAGYGITDAYTKTEVDAKIGSVYKPGGSVPFASLPTADKEHLGMVYNVTDAFTTTDSFIDGAGHGYPAGTNVVIILDGETYKYDTLSGFVDLSGKVDTEEGKGLSTNDYTDADKTKLGGIAEGATKVEASETNGNVKINGTETTVYTEPEDTVHGSVATDDEVTAMLTEVFGASEG